MREYSNNNTNNNTVVIVSFQCSPESITTLANFLGIREGISGHFQTDLIAN